MNYRYMIQNASIDFLIPIRNKMKEIILIERSRENGQGTAKESLDYVNPKECDAIQQFRIRMRKFGLKRRTENSYVGKVKAFMAARGLRCLADFENITSKDVEAHLTDLAVDGNVAPSTQNAAFHGFGSKNRMSLNFPRGASCVPRCLVAIFGVVNFRL